MGSSAAAVSTRSCNAPPRSLTLPSCLPADSRLTIVTDMPGRLAPTREAIGLVPRISPPEVLLALPVVAMIGNLLLVRPYARLIQMLMEVQVVTRPDPEVDRRVGRGMVSGRMANMSLALRTPVSNASSLASRTTLRNNTRGSTSRSTMISPLKRRDTMSPSP